MIPMWSFLTGEGLTVPRLFSFSLGYSASREPLHPRVTRRVTHRSGLILTDAGLLHMYFDDSANRQQFRLDRSGQHLCAPSRRFVVRNRQLRRPDGHTSRTDKNKIKNENTSPELHSAARRAIGFLQIVPIETASARVFLCRRPARVRGSPDRALNDVRALIRRRFPAGRLGANVRVGDNPPHGTSAGRITSKWIPATLSS